MQEIDGNLFFSARDLANFLECKHLITLDLKNLETPLPKAEDDAQTKLIQEKVGKWGQSYIVLSRENVR